MRPMTPSTGSDPLALATSVHKAMRANLSKGSPIAWDTTGQASYFNQDNTDETMIRVGSSANPHSLTSFWSGSNTDTTVIHDLGRVPIGYYIIRKDKTCDVYDGTAAWTIQDITLKCTDGTADTTLVIF